MSEKMNITPLGMQILLFLARRPNQEFYIREIASTIKKSVGGTHQTLKSLHALGFVNERKSGKNLYYQVDEKNPSIRNFKVFMTLTELHPLIIDLKGLSEKIILFGSTTVGVDTAESDVDLFILTNEAQKVKNFLKKKHQSRQIQGVVVNAAGYLKIKEHDKAFYQEINKGMVVWEKVHHE